MSRHTKDVMGNDVYYRSTSSTGTQSWLHVTKQQEEILLSHDENGNTVGSAFSNKKLLHIPLHQFDIGHARTVIEFMQVIKGMSLRPELLLAVKRYEFERADSVACTFAASLIPLYNRIRELEILPRFKKRAMELQQLQEKNHAELGSIQGTHRR